MVSHILGVLFFCSFVLYALKHLSVSVYTPVIMSCKYTAENMNMMFHLHDTTGPEFF